MNDVSQLASFFFSTSSRLFLGLPYFPYDEEAKKIARMIIFLAACLRVLSRLASLVIIGKLAHRLLRGRNYEQTTAYVSLRVLPYLGNHGRLLLNSVANSAFVVPVGKSVPTSRAQRTRSYLKTQIFFSGLSYCPRVSGENDHLFNTALQSEDI